MKKIMFNDKYGLTDAVIELRKTNTRRPCKDKATKELILANDVHSWRYYSEENIVEFVMNDGSVKVAVPPYKFGEVAAVAQQYKVLDYSFHGFATNSSRSCGIRKECAEKQKGWGNKMFVESKFMPHQIRITDVRVEQLQNISDEDITKEGITYIAGGGYGVRFGGNYNVFALNPIVAFATLIDAVSGKGTWERNPWVFAYTFGLVK